MLPEKEKLLTLVNQAIVRFSRISNEQWNARPHPEKWSKKEILGHLADSASNNIRRLVVGQYEQGTKIVYHQNEWVSYQNYQQADITEVKELWKLLNYQLARVIEILPPEKQSNVCDTGLSEVKMHTLAYFIEDYFIHLQHHLNQIWENQP